MDAANRRAPIGVFDSGIGGLTVVRALMEQLPHERLVYFGDTARVPYGPKSPDTVRRYSLQIVDWLLEQHVKAIVIACNTATAHALESLRKHVSIPVVGVVEPGARAAVAANAGGTSPIGVIGTAGTIASGAYERAIHLFEPAAKVQAIACPLFVPLVEEGWVDHPATRSIVEEYLRPMHNSGVHTLVLGCTHYPLLAPVISQVIGDSVHLIDSAEETARETARVLRQSGLMGDASVGPAQHRFVASDAPDRFLVLGRRFLGEAMTHVEQVTFT